MQNGSLNKNMSMLKVPKGGQVMLEGHLNVQVFNSSNARVVKSQFTSGVTKKKKIYKKNFFHTDARKKVT